MRKSIFMLAAVLALSSGYSTRAAAVDPDTADSQPDLALKRISNATLTNGVVHALAAHPDGGMIVGGQFVQANGGVARTHLLRVLPDGTLDPDFDVLIESGAVNTLEVKTVLVDGDAIYIGGMWDKVDGVSRVSAAKLDLDGNLLDWDAKLTAGQDAVHALAVGGGKVYLGGAIVAHDAWGLARFDEQTGAHDPNWRARTQTIIPPTEPNIGWRAQIHALIYTGTDIIVGGTFAYIAGVPRKGVARLSLAASNANVAVQPYSVDLSGNVHALARDAATGQVYIGGDVFTSSNGVSLTKLVRTDAAGTVDFGFRPNPNAQVLALQLARGKLYYGGNFRVDVDTPLYLARTPTSGNGAPDPEWLPLPNAQVWALAWEDREQRLWIGGEFTQIGNQERNGLARISFRGEFTIFRDGLED